MIVVITNTFRGLLALSSHYWWFSGLLALGISGFLFYRLEYGLLDGLAGLLMLIGLIYFLVRRLRPHWLWLDKQ